MYIFRPEIRAIRFTDVIQTSRFFVVCYHVNTEGEYPFMQVLLAKTPQIMEELFVMPTITLQDGYKSEEIETSITDKVSDMLKSMGFTSEAITDKVSYKGFVKADDEIPMNEIERNVFGINADYVALVDISKVDIGQIVSSHASQYWFALMREISSLGNICGININPNVSRFFTSNPDFCVLYGSGNPCVPLSVPLVGYTASTWNKAEFRSVFGNERQEKKWGNYYYFYRRMIDAIKNLSQTPSTSYGLNRYALLTTNTKPHYSYDDDEDTDSVRRMLEYEDSVMIVSEDSDLTPTIIVLSHLNKQIPVSYHRLFVINDDTDMSSIV